MKKSIFLILGIAITTASIAQTTPKKEEEKHLRNDIREKREENHEVAKDVSHLKFKNARADHKDAMTEKKAMHRDASKLRRRGVKHPITRARHQIHAQDEAKEHNN